jgi:hypothetical protein
MKMLLGNFNANVGKEKIFKQKAWDESLHEISNDNGIMCLSSKLSHIQKFINLLGHLLIERLTIKLTTF